MVYFCAMSKRFNIVILITFLSAGVLTCHAQQQPQTGASKSKAAGFYISHQKT